MAALQYAETVQRITDTARIAATLAPLGVTLQAIPVAGGILVVLTLGGVLL